VYLLSTLARVLGTLAALALLVWAVWPRATDTDLRATYARLRASPVPPLLVGGVLPRAASAEVSSDGYAISTEVPNVGQVSIVGRTAAGTTSSGDVEVRGQPADVSVGEQATTLTWHERAATYTLSVPGRPDDRTLSALAQRVAPLQDATRDAFGFGWDTPLLYLVYLPLGLGFFGWASGRLLAR
jgi:hypothetical protein